MKKGTNDPAEIATDDPALAALDRLIVTLDEVDSDFHRVRARAALLRAERAAGRDYRDLVPDEERPLIVEIMAQVQDKLNAAGSEWRRQEARALHAEGVPMDRIATLFGVTRQRVSALLGRGTATSG